MPPDVSGATQPGSTFVGEHGLTGGRAHAGTPYHVVGVLAPTGSVIDELVLTDLASVVGGVHSHRNDPDGARKMRVRRRSRRCW